MHYNDVLDYLLHQLPMYQREGKAAYKEGLETSHALDEYFNFPHKAYKIIHVAGTNGKGSVCHAIASSLQEAGFKVGLHTSPHYTDFRERIRVNGKMIGEHSVENFVSNNMEFFQQLKPSFFEISVFMAFWYFRESKVDYAVIEVGMGGRLDSTNVVEPLLCCITNIGLDHTKFLGDTCEKIANEKAGIIKAGVPVIIGEKHKDTEPVFRRKATTLDSQLIFAEDYAKDQHFDLKQFMSMHVDKGDAEAYFSALPAYQLKNHTTAFTVLKQLQVLSNEEIAKGLIDVRKNTAYKGRWQIVQDKPLLIVDAAHNKDGMHYLMFQIKKLALSKTIMILSFVDDKQIDEVLAMLPPDRLYISTTSSVPRSLKAEVLGEKMKNFGLNVTIKGTPGEAVEFAGRQADDDTAIIVSGSSFLVADVLNLKKM